MNLPDKLTQSQQIEALPVPLHYIEPERLDKVTYCPFEPTPLDSLSPWAIEHQQQVLEAFKLLVDTPPTDLEITDEIKSAAELNLYSTLHALAMANATSFHEWQKLEERVDTDLQRIVERAAIGTAMPEEILDVLKHTEMRKAELARVFHPYGYRMEHVEPMRACVAEAIGAENIVEKDTERPYTKLKLIPYVNPENPTRESGVMLVTYKRDIGCAPIEDGSSNAIIVVERQTALIRLDEEYGFDAGVIREMHEYTQREGHVQDWNEFFKSTGCLKFVDRAIQADTHEPFLIPLSTAVYAYNKQLVARDREDAAQRKLDAAQRAVKYAGAVGLGAATIR